MQPPQRKPVHSLFLFNIALRDPSSRLYWSSPRKMEPRLRVVRVMRPLEFLRRQIPQGGVPPDAVVKRLDVLEDARLGFRTGRVALVMHQFALQAGEETLDRRVVPALRYPTHATGDRGPARRRW